MEDNGKPKGLKAILGAEALSRSFLMLLLLVSLYLVFAIMRPFIHTIIFAAVLAVLVHPIYQRMLRVNRKRRNYYALALLTLTTLLIVLPILFVAGALVSQSLDVMNDFREWLLTVDLDNVSRNPRLVAWTAWIEEKLFFLDFDKLDIQGNLLSFSRRASQIVLSNTTNFLGNIALLITHFAIMIFVLFYFIRDGAWMVESLKKLMPLRDDQEDCIFARLKAVIFSVILGTGLTGLTQGVTAGIGFAIVGVPASVFWSAMIAFTSLIPVVGTMIVWVPAVAWTFYQVGWGWALFLAVWCMVFIGGIDNFFRPFYMRGQLGMSEFYIFMAILGGLHMFGLPGLLYGPLIIAFAMVMLSLYHSEYAELLGESEAPCEEE